MGFNPRFCVLVSRLDVQVAWWRWWVGHKPPPSRGASLPSKYLRSFQIITLPKTNSSANSRKPSQKERIVLQFSGAMFIFKEGIRLMSQKTKGRKIERADNNILRVVDEDRSRCSPPQWKTLQICKDVIPVASWIAGDWQEHAKASVGKSWVQHNMGWQFTDSSDLVADQAFLLCMIGRILIPRFGGPAAWVMHRTPHSRLHRPLLVPTSVVLLFGCEKI